MTDQSLIITPSTSTPVSKKREPTKILVEQTDVKRPKDRQDESQHGTPKFTGAVAASSKEKSTAGTSVGKNKLFYKTKFFFPTEKVKLMISNFDNDQTMTGFFLDFQENA